MVKIEGVERRPPRTAPLEQRHFIAAEPFGHRRSPPSRIREFRRGFSRLTTCARNFFLRAGTATMDHGTAETEKLRTNVEEQVVQALPVVMIVFTLVLSRWASTHVT